MGSGGATELVRSGRLCLIGHSAAGRSRLAVGEIDDMQRVGIAAQATAVHLTRRKNSLADWKSGRNLRLVQLAGDGHLAGF